MKITVELPPRDARLFLKFLNDDEGIRDAVVQQLLANNRPQGIEQMTSVVVAFGAISRGFVLALEAEKRQG